MERKLEVTILGDGSKAQKAFKNVSDSAGKFGGKLGKVFKAAALAGGVAVLALGAGVIKLGLSFDKANKAIAVATGATGDKLKGLTDSFKDTMGQVPDSMDLVAASLGTLNTLTGATGDALEDMAVQVLDASRMLGEDAAGNADAFGKAMKQWQIDSADGPELLDSLFKATQDYGVSLGGLLGNMNKFGPVMQNAGFSVGETADLMGRLESAGIQVTRVMPGMNAAFRKMAEAGKDPREELGLIFDAMKNAGSEAEALNIATTNFGAEGAQRMTTAVRNGVLSMDDLGLALEDQAGLIQDTNARTASLGDKWAEFANKMKVKVAPIAMKAMELIMAATAALQPHIETLATFITAQVIPAVARFGDEVINRLTPAFDAVRSFISDKLVPAFKDVAAFISDVIAPAVADFARVALPKIVEAFQTVASVITDRVIPAIQAAGDWFADHRGVVEGIAVVVGTALVVALGAAAVGFALTAAAAVTAGIATAAAWVVAMAPFIALVAAVAGLVLLYRNVEGFRNVVDAMAKGVTTAIGWVVDNFHFITTAVQSAFTAVKPIIAQFLTVLDPIVDTWRNVIGAIKALFTGDFAGALTAAKDAIVSALSVWLRLFVEWPAKIGVELAKAGLELVKWVGPAIPGLIVELVKMQVKLLAWFVELQGKIGIQLAKWGVEFATWASGVPGKVLSSIGNLGVVLIAKGADLIAGLASGVSNRWTNLRAWFADLGGIIVRAVPNLPGYLWPKGYDLVKGLAAGISNRWANLRKWFADLGGVVVRAIGDMGRALYNKGRDLIQGFVNGIRSKAGDIAGALASVVPGGGFAVGAAKKVAGVFGFNAAGGEVPRFAASGFTVPGRQGVQVPTILHGGERVLTQGATNFGSSQGAPMGLNVTINLHSPATTADAQRIMDQIVTYVETRGSVPPKVKKAFANV